MPILNGLIRSIILPNVGRHPRATEFHHGLGVDRRIGKRRRGSREKLLTDGCVSNRIHATRIIFFIIFFVLFIFHLLTPTTMSFNESVNRDLLLLKARNFQDPGYLSALDNINNLTAELARKEALRSAKKNGKNNTIVKVLVLIPLETLLALQTPKYGPV